MSGLVLILFSFSAPLNSSMLQTHGAPRGILINEESSLSKDGTISGLTVGLVQVTPALSSGRSAGSNAIWGQVPVSRKNGHSCHFLPSPFPPLPSVAIKS